MTGFFAQMKAEECENEYHRLQEQEFQLKMGANLSLMEINQLTAEDRNWWIDRVERYRKEQQKESSSSSAPNHHPMGIGNQT